MVGKVGGENGDLVPPRYKLLAYLESAGSLARWGSLSVVVEDPYVQGGVPLSEPTGAGRPLA